jgi:hypothetical protein
MARWLVGLIVLVLVAAGCSSSSKAPSLPAIGSIVVMGDSVAAGEGINYDYKYDSRPVAPMWSEGKANPRWNPPFPDCHQSGKAYGNVVTAARKSKLTMLACTGASYDNGIITAEVPPLLYEKGDQMGPAQFGDWANQSDLNPLYDSAQPDLVMVTLGADDVKFAQIIRYCIAANLAITSETQSELEALKKSPGTEERKKGIEKLLSDVTAPYDGYKDLDKLQKALDDRRTQLQQEGKPLPCTPDDPGPVVENEFTAILPSLGDEYTQLVQSIQQRGQNAGKTPQILFTTYYDPLPAAGADLATTRCPDAMGLAASQVDFLKSLLAELNGVIGASVPAAGAKVADLSSVMNGHELCSQDPWAYGLSILLHDKTSPAPFLPTTTGQEKIAAAVEPVLGT